MLMMIAGPIEPTDGQILINGEPVTGPRREVAVVFPQPVLRPWRTVLDNVLLPIERVKLLRSKFRQRMADLLTMSRIGDFADHLLHHLSEGMGQRASICCAPIGEPGILLRDETFSVLAITHDGKGIELPRIWQDNRKTVVFVTHSIREAGYLAAGVPVIGPRPATVIDDVVIDLPRQRDISLITDGRFNQHVRRLRKASHVR